MPKHHKFAPEIFKAYDVRGKFGNNLNPEDAYYLGLAFARMTLELKRRCNHAPGLEDVNLAVGRDARESSFALQEALVSGLCEGGADVRTIGLVPTPCLYFAIHHYNLDGGIMITGSHNPSEYNGFKINVGSHSLHGESLKELMHIAESGITPCEHPGDEIACDPTEAYIAAMMRGIKMVVKPLRIGIDCLNGSAGGIVKKLVHRLPFQFELFNCECTGDFSSILPEPSNVANITRLKHEVKHHKLDVMFVLDGDGDRILAVTKRGNVLYGDDITLLLATSLFSHGRVESMSSRKVIIDVKCSMVLEEEIKKFGGIPVVYKTGHSLIKQKMHDEGAIMAGEMSGHIYINDGTYYPYDDGLFAMLRLMEVDCNTDADFDAILSEVAQTIKSPEIKIPCSRRAEAMEKIRALLLAQNPSKVYEIDGVKAYFDGGQASILVRPSNTEEILVARLEAKTQESYDILEQLLREAKALATHSL